ncbi:MAG: hypothetical protein ACJAUG_002828 [Halioglobus sp.]|jgi:hypothetical protein
MFLKSGKRIVQIDSQNAVALILQNAVFRK